MIAPIGGVRKGDEARASAWKGASYARIALG